ncbi:MAG: MBL fold metallo-hydrolase [Rhodothermales bacterium]|nr:MBL fold metallo-hydrolase [Rhodothermales bacterium]MDG2017155.1 MBL fold metallo-hydrolase [Rhodothermales bacterium]HAY37445.1 MBL fold metallo-hydrolase [Bacteroidota bacterium]
MSHSRRQFLSRSAMVAALAVLPAPFKALAARSRFNFTPVRRGVGIFEARGGTIGWLVRDKALVAVDSQFPESAQACLDGLTEKSGRRMDLLINSHHHGDHTAGNSVLGANARHIVAQSNVPVLQKRFYGKSEREQKYADITFEETWTQDLGDETIALNYFGPGHTGGDSVIHFQNADVAHMGDLVFNHRHAYIDLPAGCDTRNWMTVLERTYDMFTDNTVFIFGHGNPTHGILGTRDDVLVMRDYLGALRKAVSDGIRDGKSSADIAALGLEGFESHRIDGSTKGIEGNLMAVYEELTEAVE